MPKISLLKIVVITLAFFLTAGINTNKAQASNFAIQKNELQIKVNTDSDTKFTSVIEIKNNDKSKIVSGYEYILPFKATDVKANLNKIDSSVKISTLEGDYTKLEIDFNTNIIAPGKSKNLVITGSVQNFIQYKGNTRFLILNSTKDSKTKTVISFPESFGEPNFTTIANIEKITEDKLTTLNLKNRDSLILVWGNEYITDLKTSYKLKNDQNRILKTFINLIPDTYSQDVEYNSVYNSLFALFDALGNTFAVTEIHPLQENEVGFEARVIKKYKELKITDIDYEFNLPAGSALTKAIDEKVSEETNYLKLKQVNDFLVTSFKISDGEFNFTDLNTQWKSMEQKSKYNSFDYCFVLTAYAKKLGYKTQIEYGYVLLPFNSTKKLEPHFWCVFKDEEKAFMADPYLEVSKGMDYFGTQSDFDRVTMGVWHYNQNYNNALGMLKKDNFIKTLELTEVQINNSYDEYKISSLDSNTTAYSGFYHNLDLLIINPTNKVQKFKSLKYRGNNFNNSLRILDDLYLALLPNQENKIKIPRLRTYNFFENATKEVDIKFTTQDDTEIDFKVMIKYVVNDGAIIAGVVIFNAVLIFTVYLIWRRLKKV